MGEKYICGVAELLDDYQLPQTHGRTTDNSYVFFKPNTIKMSCKPFIKFQLKTAILSLEVWMEREKAIILILVNVTIASRHGSLR